MFKQKTLTNISRVPKTALKHIKIQHTYNSFLWLAYATTIKILKLHMN